MLVFIAKPPLSWGKGGTGEGAAVPANCQAVWGGGEGLIGAVGRLMSGPCWDSVSLSAGGVDPKVLSSWLLCSGMWAECLEWVGPGFWQRHALAPGLCLGGSLMILSDSVVKDLPPSCHTQP